MKIKSKMILGVSLFAMTFSFETTAQTCKTMPTCAELGYTETSCSGDSLKCPFDTSKLYCVAMCPEPCEVGSIYYSDDTCHKKLIASKTPIGVVYDMDRKLVLSLDRVRVYWHNGSEHWKDTTVPNYSSEAAALKDFNGKSNTDTLIAFAKSSGMPHQAPQYCHDMKTGGKTWYLPAFGEMQAMATNFSVVNASLSIAGVPFDDNVHWSSTEFDQTNAWVLRPDDHDQFKAYKASMRWVRCVFTF